MSGYPHSSAVAPDGEPVVGSRVVSMSAERTEPARAESSREGLVRRMAAGDHAAMVEFYDQTNQMVYGLALRILADAAAAEDILVEVYSQVWQQAGGYDVLMRASDYCSAGADTVHDGVSSPSGCTFVVTASTGDELLA